MNSEPLNTSVISIGDLEELNLNIIENKPWMKEMWKQVEQFSRKGFLHWCLIVENVAKSDQDCVNNWQRSFISGLDELYSAFIMEIRDIEQKTKDEIQRELIKYQNLCKELQQTLPPNIGAEELCLLDELNKLKKQISELESLKSARLQTVQALLTKQKEFYQHLGKRGKIFKINPLPSEQKVQEFERHLEVIEKEVVQRTEKCRSIRQDILKLATQLRYIPQNEFEEQVLLNESYCRLSDEDITQLLHFLTYLNDTTDHVEQELKALSRKLDNLWSILDVEPAFREDFRNKVQSNCLEALTLYRQEIQKCEELRKANIQVFIEKTRKELASIWAKCHRDHEEMLRKFSHFTDDFYTEDLLELHDIELQKWLRFYEENSSLLTLIDKHKKLWLRVAELEENASGLDRFKNRGGQLLQEEKERNKLSKLIPKLEQEMVELAAKFSKEHGQNFTTYGRTVTEYIGKLHFERENNRKLKLSERKAQRDRTPTRGPTPVRRTPLSARKAPKLKSSKKKSPPKVTCRALTLPKQKRRSRHSSSTLNSSTPRAKRRLPLIKITDVERDTTYSAFEMKICNNASRSTHILPKMPFLCDEPLRCSPAKPPKGQSRRGTPATTPKNRKAPPSGGSRHGTPSSSTKMKLFF